MAGSLRARRAGPFGMSRWLVLDLERVPQRVSGGAGVGSRLGGRGDLNFGTVTASPAAPHSAGMPRSPGPGRPRSAKRWSGAAEEHPGRVRGRSVLTLRRRWR
jgi:hypothetical protein